MFYGIDGEENVFDKEYFQFQKIYIGEFEFMAKKYYAVKQGHKIGIFDTWAECKKNVDGYSGAVFKSFTSKADAKMFIIGETAPVRTADAEAIAYVDGSYDVKSKRFSFGAVIFADGQEYTLSEAFSDKELAAMRNVAGEIKGSEAAMRFCIERGIKSLDIYHDYEGIAKWCTGEWKTNKTGTAAYAEYYKSIKNVLSVRFVKVKGHSGDKYNDMADRLAKSALGL